MPVEDLAENRSSSDDDGPLLDALRAGDEGAFAKLVDTYHAPMLRVARSYVATKEAAEDVVQEAWLGLIKGLDRFEGRSSLKTWLFRIVINRAMTRGGREARTVPFSSLAPDHPSVDPSQFNQSGRWAGWWLRENSVSDLPERVVVAKESRSIIGEVISTLPANQRLVISLRDVQGFSSDETCQLLGVSEANQRVLLHRARTRVRAALERYAGEAVGADR
jgi:RNA polymerase sigma-70 factor (ECF subfamily)